MVGARIEYISGGVKVVKRVFYYRFDLMLIRQSPYLLPASFLEKIIVFETMLLYRHWNNNCNEIILFLRLS